MNELIGELNLQAMSIVMNGSDTDGDVEQLYIPSEFTKKFAELIVRECAAVVFRKTGPKSALNVLEHFGVEE